MEARPPPLRLSSVVQAEAALLTHWPTQSEWCRGSRRCASKAETGKKRRGGPHALHYSTPVYLFGGRPWLLWLLPYDLVLCFQADLTSDRLLHEKVRWWLGSAFAEGVAGRPRAE